MRPFDDLTALHLLTLYRRRRSALREETGREPREHRRLAATFLRAEAFVAERPLPYVPIDPNMPEHPKTRALRKVLGVGHRQTRLLLFDMFLWVGRMYPSGRITTTEEEVAHGCDWGADPQKLVSALVQTGWFDPIDPEGGEGGSREAQGWVLHGWRDHGGWVYGARQVYRQKKANQRAAKKAMSPLDRDLEDDRDLEEDVDHKDGAVAPPSQPPLKLAVVEPEKPQGEYQRVVAEYFRLWELKRGGKPPWSDPKEAAREGKSIKRCIEVYGSAEGAVDAMRNMFFSQWAGKPGGASIHDVANNPGKWGGNENKAGIID